MLETDILNLEKELLKQEIRNNPNRIMELVSEDFIEYCSSGFIYKYNKNDTFDGSNTTDWEIVDFSIKELSENVCLALYKLIGGMHLTQPTTRCSIMSIWKIIQRLWLSSKTALLQTRLAVIICSNCAGKMFLPAQNAEAIKCGL